MVTLQNKGLRNTQNSREDHTCGEVGGGHRWALLGAAAMLVMVRFSVA